MKTKKYKFFIALAIIITILAGSVLGGYFLIDRVLVPRYFGDYGIHDLGELVELVETIYKIPDEKDFISNPFTKSDSKNLVKKFTNAGFPTLPSGEIDYESMGKGTYTRSPSEDFTDTELYLTDREVAALVDQILDSGVLVSNFPDLAYLDTLKMTVKQVTILPDVLTTDSKEYDNTLDSGKLQYSKSSASLSATVKIDTESARQQIAKNLDAPKFLIDWIIPDSLYVSATFHTHMDEDGREIDNAELSINGKTPKQSEVLLKLLISFIYPDNKNMTIADLSAQLGNLVLTGIDLSGTIEFTEISVGQTHDFGVKLTLPEIAEITKPTPEP